MYINRTDLLSIFKESFSLQSINLVHLSVTLHHIAESLFGVLRFTDES